MNKTFVFKDLDLAGLRNRGKRTMMWLRYARSPRFVLSFLLGLALASCTSNSESLNEHKDGETIDLTHYNIVFAPDLSNRIDRKMHPRPLNDQQIVHAVLNNIYPTILNHQRSDNQLDKFSVSLVNKKLVNEYDIKKSLLSIDFSQFKNQKERIDYIKGRSPETMEADIQNFEQEFGRIHEVATKNTFGADVWSYLNAGVDNLVVQAEKDPIIFNGTTYRNQYRNVLILLTDGYIEAGIYDNKGCPEKNQCYYLSGDRVKQFREAFKKSGERDMQAFFEKNNYGIVPVNNPYLEDVEILVLEMYDRSLSKGGSATVHPTDTEILKLFWSDWLEKSKVKRYELRPLMTTEEEVEQVVMNFIGVK
jgi:hypothetical protein